MTEEYRGQYRGRQAHGFSIKTYAGGVIVAEHPDASPVRVVNGVNWEPIDPDGSDWRVTQRQRSAIAAHGGVQLQRNSESGWVSFYVTLSNGDLSFYTMNPYGHKMYWTCVVTTKGEKIS